MQNEEESISWGSDADPPLIMRRYRRSTSYVARDPKSEPEPEVRIRQWPSQPSSPPLFSLQQHRRTLFPKRRRHRHRHGGLLWRWRHLRPLTESASASDISFSWVGIAYPAVAYSRRLYFKSSTFNVEVKGKEDEPVDKLINRFRKEVLKAGVLQECKRRRFFENKQDKKNRKAREAAARNRKRRPQTRARAQNKHEAPNKKKDDEEDDNWELPDVDPPYC